MNYSLLMEQRLACFKKILSQLPPTSELPAELLIMSGGRQKGNWSYRHIFTEEDTMYFIFRKSIQINGDEQWECVDRELDEVMRLSASAA